MASREQGARETAETFLTQFNSADNEYKYFGSDVFSSDISIQSVSVPPAGSTSNVPVSVVVRCRIPESFTNRVGNLHGGAAATMFDNMNSTALAVWALHCADNEGMRMRWIRTGVSRTLNVSYLRPLKVGDEVDVLNEVVSVGKNLALVRGIMTRVKDGKIICTSEHHKMESKQIYRYPNKRLHELVVVR